MDLVKILTTLNEGNSNKYICGYISFEEEFNILINNTGMET